MTENKITVVDNNVYIAWCYPERRLIHHQFRTYCKGDAFRSSITKALEAFEKYKCYKWLSDDRNFMGVLNPEDWKWGETNFTDRAIALGWKYSAMVLPEQMIAKLSTMALSNVFAAKGLTANFFSDFDQAQKWINEQT